MKTNIKQYGLTLFLLALSCSFINPAQASMTYPFSMGPALEYSLPVNEPLVLINQFMWTVKGQCTMLSKDNNSIVAFRALRKSGTINNMHLSSGDSVTLTLRPKEVVYITAAPGAKVELLNQGTETIKALCSTY